MSLNTLRDRLSAVDHKLVDLIAERQEIVGEIGRSKLSTGAATRDYAREKLVLDEGRAAINEFNGQEVGGRRLNVNEARPREPRR